MMLVDLARSAVAYEAQGARLLPAHLDHRLISYDEGGVVAGLDSNKKFAVWDLATGKKRAL